MRYSLAQTANATLWTIGFILLGGTWLQTSRIADRWDPFDHEIEVSVKREQDAPLCLSAKWMSRCGVPENPCSEVSVPTCQRAGESFAETVARHVARIAEAMESCPRDADCGN